MARNSVRLQLILDGKDALRSLRAIEREYGSLEKAGVTSTRKIDNSTDRLTDTNKRASNTLRNGLIAGYAALGFAVQQGVSRAIEKGKELESQLAGLEAITGITGIQLERLGETSLELSTKYGVSASNIIEANKLVASQLAEKIDFGTEEGFLALQKVSEEAVVLSQAAGIQLSEAVATTTSVINQFNLEAGESARVINTLAAGAKFGAAEVPQIGMALVNAGAAASSAGQSIETTNAAIQVLAANGQTGERAGTALRSIFIKLQTESEKLAKLGIGEVDVKANGLTQTLKQLAPVVDNTTELSKIFGAEAINQIQILVRNAESVESLTEKVTGTGVAYDQAEVRLNTFEGASNQLTETINSKLIVAFQESDGVLVKLIRTLTEWVEQTAFAVGVINDFFDAYSKIKDELNQSNQALRIQTSRLAETKQALLDQIEAVEKGSEKERLLFEELESVTVSLVARKRALEEDKKSLGDSVLAQTAYVKKLKETETGLFANTKKVEEAEETLKVLELQYKASEQALDVYDSAVKTNTKSTQVSTGATEESTEVISGNVEAYKALKEQIAEISALEPPSFELEDLAFPDVELPDISEPFKEIDLGGLITLENSLQGLTDKINEYKEQQKLATSPEQYQVLQDKINETGAQIRTLTGENKNFEETFLSLKSDGVSSIASIEQAIQNLVSNGYSLQSQEVQKLIDLQKEYNEVLETQDSFTSTLRDNSIKSFADIGNAIREQVIIAIKARIAESIATQIAKILATVPFPFNIALAAGAGAAVSALFNQIPEFATGVTNFEGGTALVGEQGRELITNSRGVFLAEQPQLINLPKGSNVITNENTEKVLREFSNENTLSESKQSEKSESSNIFESRKQESRMFEELVTSAVLNGIITPEQAIKTIVLDKFEKGGLVGGKPHSQGGTIIEAEKNEFVVNRRSTSEAPSVLKLINSSPESAKVLENIVTNKEADSFVRSNSFDRSTSNVSNPFVSNNTFVGNAEKFTPPNISSFANTITQNSVNNIQSRIDTNGMAKEISGAISSAMSGAVLKVGKTGELIVEFRKESRRLKELGSDDFIPFKSLG